MNTKKITEKYGSMELNITLSHFCSLKFHAYATPLSPSLTTLVWPSVVPNHKIDRMNQTISNLQQKSGILPPIIYSGTLNVIYLGGETVSIHMNFVSFSLIKPSRHRY